MRKLILLPALLLACICLRAQTNVVFFTENGEKMWIILNGIRQNQDPQTNIKIASIPANLYSVKIIFADTANGVINDRIGPQDGNEITYVVRRRKEASTPKNGGRPELYAIKRMSMIPIAQAPPPMPGNTTQTVTYTTTPPPPPNGVNMNMYTGDAGFNVTMSVQGAGTDGANINMNMNGAPPPPNGGTDINMNMNSAPPPPPDVNATNSYVVTNTTTTTTPGGCTQAMYDADFDAAQQDISSKTFENTKLDVAKQVINSNCMTAAQIATITKLFTYDDTKLKFAKYAYPHCVDRNNYFKVNSAFQFESNTSELTKYIQSQPK